MSKIIFELCTDRRGQVFTNGSRTIYLVRVKESDVPVSSEKQVLKIRR